MNYNDYKKSRDLSWQILIDQNITELPVQIAQICDSIGIKCIGYSRARKLLSFAGLEHHCNDTDGFTLNDIIFYNDVAINRQRQRFTIAHELGHIVLEHGRSFTNREPDPFDAPEESEANIFASRLLAPACVLWGCKVTEVEQIAKLCDISLASAEFRKDRLQKLYERERQFLITHGRSCFLMNPLEQRVSAQFSNYITTHRCRPS